MKLFIAALSCMLCSVLSENMVTVENSCPRNALEKVGDERYFSVVNDTCFLFVTYKQVTYETAKTSCENSKGKLAMPKTKELNDFLLQEMLKLDVPVAMWIGMNDKEVEGKNVWEDGTDVVSWGNLDFWTNGLVGAFEDCMALDPNDGEWHDYRCSTKNNEGFFAMAWIHSKLPFICQYPIETAEDDKLDQIIPTVGQGPSVDVKNGSGSSGDVKDESGSSGDVKDGSGSSGDVKDESGSSGDVKDESGSSGDVKGEPGFSGDVKGEPGSSGDVKDESGSSGDVKDEFGPSGDVKDESGSSGHVKDESGSSGDVKDESGSSGDVKDESGSPGDVKGEPGSSGDVKGEPGSSEPVQDSSVVKEDTCPPFDCPNLDCRMNGFKIKDGCQICECDV